MNNFIITLTFIRYNLTYCNTLQFLHFNWSEIEMPKLKLTKGGSDSFFFFIFNNIIYNI